MIWAIYRFASRRCTQRPDVPAPAFLSGVDTFLLRGAPGTPSFFWERGDRGWWYYFPVARGEDADSVAAVVDRRCLVAFADVKTRRDWRTASLTVALTMLVISTTVRWTLAYA
jgi:hypothetical protein